VVTGSDHALPTAGARKLIAWVSDAAADVPQQRVTESRTNA
jgi:hypothetical protein